WSSEFDPAKAVPLRLQALACYQVMERDDWDSVLERRLVEPGQVAKVRRALHDQLLWLARDIVVRQEAHETGRKLARAESASRGRTYLSKAEAAFHPTSTFYTIRAVCREALGEKDTAQADRELARQTAPTIALDHYLRGLSSYKAGNKVEAVEQFEEAL